MPERTLPHCLRTSILREIVAATLYSRDRRSLALGLIGTSFDCTMRRHSRHRIFAARQAMSQNLGEL